MSVIFLITPPLTTTQAIPSTILIDGVGVSFTPVTAANGVGTLSFALTGGTLPTGLTFSTSTGLISGTPTTVLALTTFTVTVTDQTTPTPQTSSKTFQLTANAALVTVQAIPSRILTDGSATSFTPVTASGGTGTRTFALTGGILSGGLTFSTANGLISGTPTTVLALTTFTVTVTDQTTPTPQTSSKTFQLTVNAALATVQAIPTITVTDGTAVSFTPVTASGGTGTRTFALSGGTLPSGLTFSTVNGLISGNPTTTLAQTTFTVTVTDQTTPTPQTSSKTFQLTATATTSPLADANTLAASLGYAQSRKVWEDLFVGPNIDSTKWIPQMADQFGIWTDQGQLPLPYSAPNGNGIILEYYDPAQITVNNGLTFTMVPSSTFSNLGYTYKSAAMTTHGKFYITSGLAIAKIWAPDTTNGCWPGFWMLEGGVEMDILQGGFFGAAAGTPINQANFPAVFQPNGSFIGPVINVGVDMSNGYHLYACEYLPGVSVKMWCDNFLMLNLNTSNSAIPSGGMTLVLTHEMASSQAAGYRTAQNANTLNTNLLRIRGVQLYQ